ncbi:hypothetical protein EMCRGX_G019918 [Ephydatia muelleri]
MVVAMKRTVDKHTLNNFLRHVDAHNKIQEEREMWRLRELERKSDYEKTEWPSRAPLLTRGRLVSDVFDDSETEGGTFHTSASHAPASTYWTRQLIKAEENDPFRWGHSGFKEQNPEEFVSTDDENNHGDGNDKVNDKERKRHKRKKHKQKDRHSNDESSDEEEMEQKHKKKAKRNKANSKKVKKSKKRSSKAKQ